MPSQSVSNTVRYKGLKTIHSKLKASLLEHIVEDWGKNMAVMILKTKLMTRQ